MTRIAAALLALALGLCAALALASCGGSSAKLLPGTTAQQITENLNSVRELAAEGECVSAEDEAQQVSTQVDDLQGIDAQLKEALQKGAVKLNEVVETCTEDTIVETTEETVPTTTETTTPKPLKEKKPKPEKTEPPAHQEIEETEPPEETTTPTPPKGEGKGPEESPETGKPEPPSGGIGPGTETGTGG